MIEKAQAAKRLPLDNANTPNRPTLNEADQADMEVFLGHLLQILPLLGISAFERPSRARQARKKRLFVETKGIKAEGYESTEGFIVYAGSLVHRRLRQLSSWVETPMAVLHGKTVLEEH